MSSVIIIGGGAAGMMASIIAARNGHKVTLLEKNDKLGKKLFITGKGRCNFTNAGDSEDIFNSVVTNKKFLYSAFNSFSNYDVMGFFDELGLKFKIERGNRVFPLSDHSSDVIGTLSREMRRLDVNVELNAQVEEVLHEKGVFTGVKVHMLSDDKKKVIEADSLIVATGGNSYSSTGSTGDGYRFAKSLGHTVTQILPALVPFVVKEEWEKELQGLSLKNVHVAIYDGKREVYSEFGEMLFTHFGVSGPTVLSASSFAAGVIKIRELSLVIDLKPALTFEQLDERILRDFEEVKNKAFKNSLDKLLPKKLIPVIINLSGIDAGKQVNAITREERHRLVKLLKNLELTLTGLRGFNEAIITHGGVSVKEINPSTMESKLVKNVFFAGEVIDVDAVTGGFNLQIAWSTAYAAAMHLK
ncbi:MAG: NAD(P)/FAD-dependent oxidoreductase [Eubacteriales bacterium]|nr:NAD(P)/FAD-dependent oxidoreductase [Eubacteriales bacterium]